MYRNLMSVKAFVLVAFVAAVGCTKKAEKDTPQGTLSEYVSRSFAARGPVDKDRLLELTSGQAKALLESINDAEFRESFLDQKREFVSLKIRDERKLGEDRHSITYELTYREAGGESKNTVTGKKHAVFAKENGKWLISEVRNIKTFIEHENEMSIEP